MTPTNKTKNKDGAEVRSMELLNVRAKETEDTEAEPSYIVEGYAARYEPYVLYKDGDDEILEQFSRENFEGADRSDIIFQYDHSGRVYARSSNGSLEVEPDEVGLHIKADLGRTASARELYEDIKAGMVTKMSWRFSVDSDDYEYNKKTKTITYKKIGRIYDVSAVSIPANENTSISARNFVDGVISEELARIEAEQQIERRKAELLARLGGKTNDND